MTENEARKTANLRELAERIRSTLYPAKFDVNLLCRRAIQAADEVAELRLDCEELKEIIKRYLAEKAS